MFKSEFSTAELQEMLQHEKARNVFNKYRHFSNYDEVNVAVTEQEGKRHGKRYLMLVASLAKEALQLDVGPEFDAEVRGWALEKRDQALKALRNGASI